MKTGTRKSKNGKDGEAMRCELCGMFTMDLERHKRTKMCKLNQERRKEERLQNRQAEAGDQKFFVYGHELEKVREFQWPMLCHGLLLLLSPQCVERRRRLT